MSKICDDLRAAILQSAMQGKLTDQLPTDDNVDDLLASIQTERQKLIKAGKLKKQKPLPPITDDDKPFTIPDSWRWVRLGEVAKSEIKRGKSPSYGESDNSFAFAQKCNSKYDGIRYDLAKSVTDESVARYSNNAKLEVNDIVLNSTGGGTLGRAGYIEDIPNGKNYYPDSHVTLIRTFVNQRYVYYFCKMNQKMFEDGGEGSTNQIELKAAFVNSRLFPLPPIVEQKRIVAKLDKLMDRVNRLEKTTDALASIKSAFPSDLKSALLQAAMQGKLTDQLPTDDNVDDLFANIQAERQKLTKEGKLKKQKPLPPITDDDKPFAIPSTWRWVRLGEVAELLSGTDLKPNEYNGNENGTVYLTGASNITGDGLVINRWTAEPTRIALKGDVLITCKGTVGTTYVLDIDEAHIARQIMAIRCNLVSNLYVKLFIDYYSSELKRAARSIIPGIERKDVVNAPFPLPPLAEQKRIVEKLDHLLPICDHIAQLSD